jgi:uncharacterized protein with PIN domain
LIVIDTSALVAIVNREPEREDFLNLIATADRRSKASLNYCDCIVYALAKTMNAPLLFKGADFSETDIVASARELNP